MPRNNENSIPVANFAIEGYVAAETRHGVTGELVDRVENHNIVVNLGLNDIAKLISGVTPSGGVAGWDITKGAIGTVNTQNGNATQGAVATDTSLTGAVFSAGAITKDYTAASGTGNTGAQVRFEFSYAPSVANGATYKEVGLCRNDTATFESNGEGSNNVLFSRATHGDIAKTADVTLSYTYDLFFKTSS